MSWWLSKYVQRKLNEVTREDQRRYERIWTSLQAAGRDGCRRSGWSLMIGRARICWRAPGPAYSGICAIWLEK